MESSWKGKVLFVLDPRQGYATAKIRGLIYEEILNHHGWYIEYVSISSYGSELEKYRKSPEEIIKMANDFDIVYLLKVNAYGFIRNLRKRTNAKLIFDLTDALWRRNLRKSWIFLEEILQISDAIFSENEYVSEYGKRYNKHVFSLAACTQTEKFDEYRKTIAPRTDNKVILGWIGSESTKNAIFSIIRPLQQLCANYHEVELRILGCSEGILKNKLKNIRFTSLYRYSEDDMIREAVSMDVGIFPPPVDLVDYRIRGALKGMIYMSAGIPAVCFNAGDSAKIITDGINGVLVNTEDEWYTKIERLIKEPLLRKRIGQLGYESIVKDHSLSSVGSELSKAFAAVLNLPRNTYGDFSVLNKIKILTKTLVSN